MRLAGACSSRPRKSRSPIILREGIIAGRIARGARLKQQEIATQLNTSITPVREALKLLEAEGYVTGDSYKGAVVAPFDIAASREVLDLRILLETQLVKGAVAHASAADIAELKELAADFARAFRARRERGRARRQLPLPPPHVRDRRACRRPCISCRSCGRAIRST